MGIDDNLALFESVSPVGLQITWSMNVVHPSYMGRTRTRQGGRGRGTGGGRALVSAPATTITDTFSSL